MMAAPYTAAQRAELRQRVQRFLAGELRELDTRSAQEVREAFEIFRIIHNERLGKPGVLACASSAPAQGAGAPDYGAPPPSGGVCIASAQPIATHAVGSSHAANGGFINGAAAPLSMSNLSLGRSPAGPPASARAPEATPPPPGYATVPGGSSATPGSFNPGAASARRPVQGGAPVFGTQPAVPVPVGASCTPTPASRQVNVPPPIVAPAAAFSATPPPQQPYGAPCAASMPSLDVSDPQAPRYAAYPPAAYASPASNQPQQHNPHVYTAAALGGGEPPAAACAPSSSATVLPGDPRTLGFGTDQGRWLADALKGANSGAANPFRQQRQY
jgi:hypothetical protein